MKIVKGMLSSRVVIRLIPALLLVLLLGCGSSLHESMQEMFNQDPVMAIEYQPAENLTLYKSRNILIDAGYQENKLTSLVMQAILVAQGVPPETPVIQSGVLRFRSLDLRPRFQEARDLTLHIAGYTFDLGSSTMDNVSQQEGRTVEDLSIGVPGQLIIAIAGADTVRGTLGPVPFEMVGEKLRPIRAMVDSVAAMEKNTE